MELTGREVIIPSKHTLKWCALIWWIVITAMLYAYTTSWTFAFQNCPGQTYFLEGDAHLQNNNYHKGIYELFIHMVTKFFTWICCHDRECRATMQKKQNETRKFHNLIGVLMKGDHLSKGYYKIKVLTFNCYLTSHTYCTFSDWGMH